MTEREETKTSNLAPRLGLAKQRLRESNQIWAITMKAVTIGQSKITQNG